MAKFEIFLDEGGDYRWRLLSGIGELIAESAGGYEAKAFCQLRIEQVKRAAAAALVEDLSARPIGREAGRVLRPSARWRRKA